MDAERSVLQWGGLAGILGGILFIVTIVILLGFVPPAPATTAGLVNRFPSVSAAITVGDTLDLVAVILWVPLFLALYRTLRGPSLAPALFGTALSLVGLVLAAAGAAPTVALGPISNLYHSAGTTSAQQDTLVLLWQAIQGIFNETDTVAFVFTSIGFIVLAMGMLRAPAFGKVFGGISFAFGVVGVIGVSLFSINSPSFAPFAIPAYIVFPLLFGWKVYSLSRTA